MQEDFARRVPDGCDQRPSEPFRFSYRSHFLLVPTVIVRTPYPVALPACSAYALIPALKQNYADDEKDQPQRGTDHGGDQQHRRSTRCSSLPLGILIDGVPAFPLPDPALVWRDRFDLVGLFNHIGQAGQRLVM